MLAEEGRSRGFNFNNYVDHFVIIDSSTMIFDASSIHFINIIRSVPSKHLNARLDYSSRPRVRSFVCLEARWSAWR